MTRVRTSKIRIPAQRGRGSGPAAHVFHLGDGAEPVVVVVPHAKGSLTSRFALATARLAWRHRVALAPTGAGVGLFIGTGVLALTVPAAAVAMAVPALLLPAGWAVAAYRHPRPVVRRRARALAVPVVVASAALAWSAAAVWFGPANGVVALPWLIGVFAAQGAWWQHRRKKPTAPLAADQS
ncbi:hypothetical protein ACFC6L_15505 [Kitasatospora phosalacinea]|uniref:hypothetical protein n=1 Tax=Kitasatospora phosalacinea TaxID=2065 RepID=UPI0035E0AE3D